MAQAPLLDMKLDEGADQQEARYSFGTSEAKEKDSRDGERV